MSYDNLPPNQPRPASWWSEEDGDVIWWVFGEDGLPCGRPCIGSPLNTGIIIDLLSADNREKVDSIKFGGLPGDYTHWTPIPNVCKPQNDSENKK